MTQRKFSNEFKIEALRLVTDLDVAVAQVARYLYVLDSVLRRWMCELTATPAMAFSREWADACRPGRDSRAEEEGRRATMIRQYTNEQSQRLRANNRITRSMRRLGRNLGSRNTCVAARSYAAI